MKQYNKLVRDRIPEILVGLGKKHIIQTLDQSDVVPALTLKLCEETEEFVQSGQVEELADLLEVIYALSRAKGMSPTELEAVRSRKCHERGGFEQGYFLVEADE